MAIEIEFNEWWDANQSSVARLNKRQAQKVWTEKQFKDHIETMLGGVWQAERDDPAVLQIVHKSIEQVILGLCLAVAQSPEHKLTSLADAVPLILAYASLTCDCPVESLCAVAESARQRALECLKDGRWALGTK